MKRVKCLWGSGNCTWADTRNASGGHITAAGLVVACRTCPQTHLLLVQLQIVHHNHQVTKHLTQQRQDLERNMCVSICMYEKSKLMRGKSVQHTSAPQTLRPLQTDSQTQRIE
mgnify:CR=1 FL=1